MIKQGDPADEMYFVESGLVTIELELPNNKHLRLRSIRGGAMVGEVGMYLQQERTASVIAARPSVVYRLSAQSLKTMQVKDSEVAAQFHEWIARLLAERIADNNRIIEALME